RRALIEDLISSTAVVADGAGVDQHPRLALRGADRTHHSARGEHTALLDLLLVRARPPLAGDARPGEVDDRVRAFHGPRRACEARKRRGRVTPLPERPGQRTADQSARSRHHHTHVRIDARAIRAIPALLSAP